jgi:hypothetical protein
MLSTLQRLDLWSVYLDMEIRLGQENAETVRHLFERAIHMKLSVKKMKFLFKRYLQFEKQFGTPATQEVPLSLTKKRKKYFLTAADLVPV